jgi:hypothetical protein
VHDPAQNRSSDGYNSYLESLFCTGPQAVANSEFLCKYEPYKHKQLLYISMINWNKLTYIHTANKQ